MSVITDNFNRANAANLGGNWTQLNGQQAIASNKCVPTDVFSEAVHNTALASADHYAQFVATAWGDQSGPIVRCDGSTRTFYFCINNGSAIIIYKKVAGTNTVLASVGGQTFVDGDTVRLEANGTTIRVLVNGVQIASVTDSSISTGNHCGIYQFLTSEIADDFEADDLAPPAPDPAELDVTQNGDALADGGTDAAGNIVQGVTTERSYTLANNGGSTGGGSTLNIASITFGAGITEKSGGGYTQLGSGTTIARGASKTLTVLLDSSTLGAFSSSISIDSDDSDEDPYNWTVSGVVTDLWVLSSPFVALDRPHWGSWAEDYGSPASPGDIIANTCRYLQAILEDATSIRLVFGNGYFGGIDEDPTAPDLTIKATVEQPAGTFHAVTFHGLSSITLAAGEVQQSDVISGVTVTAGVALPIRIWIQSAGSHFPVNPGVSHSATGEGWSNTGADETSNGSATWARISAGNPYVFTTVGVLGTAPARTGFVGILGDSITAGTGYVQNPVEDAGVKSCVIGYPGDSVWKFNGNDNGSFGSPVRLCLAKRCDWVVVEYGINDLNGGKTAAQIISGITTLVGNLNVSDDVLGVYVLTLTPDCTSTDDFATLANQGEYETGVYPTWARRQTYNTWVRDGSAVAAGAVGIFDTAAEVQDVSETDKWAVHASKSTIEGVHMTAAGIVLANQAIDAGEFVLDNTAPTVSSSVLAGTGLSIALTLSEACTRGAGTIQFYDDLGNFFTPSSITDSGDGIHWTAVLSSVIYNDRTLLWSRGNSAFVDLAGNAMGPTTTDAVNTSGGPARPRGMAALLAPFGFGFGM